MKCKADAKWNVMVLFPWQNSIWFFFFNLDAVLDAAVEPINNQSLEEILAGISPPPPPAMTNEPGAPRLMITHIVNQNFKSYAQEQILGPFHKVK